MPSSPQIAGKALIKIMKKHGFVEHTRNGSHCVMKNETTGKRTVIPVHNKDIGKWLLSAILKQSGLWPEILEQEDILWNYLPL